MATAVVTGTERGLGLALAACLAARGDEVYATCLERSPELNALGVHVIGGLDVSRDDSVQRLAAEVDADRVDLLISNAGLNTHAGGYADADCDRMVADYQVNALGAVRLVRTLLSKLGEGSKIALVSTGAGAAVPGGRGARGEHYGYRMAKGALNVYGATIAHDLQPRGIAVVLLNPGAMDTKHMRDAQAATSEPLTYAMRTPEAVAPEMLAQIDQLSLETSGRWVDGQGNEVRG